MESNIDPRRTEGLSSSRAGVQPEALLFAITIFLSAYLLFQVQPLISKFILPWFGGSPAVWTTAMLFFQSALFGGYVYAHLLSRLESRQIRTVVHIGLLAAAAVMAIMILPDPSLKPSGDESPSTKILLLLGFSVGLPYFCLATTGPLVQHWFAQVFPGRSAFRLYALSNVGSFLALLSFPYVFEPRMPLPQLGRLWTYGFWLFAVLCAAITLRAHFRSRIILGASKEASAETTDQTETSAQARPTMAQRVLWVVLPALASLAFIATTDHVSHDIAPEPRLWIATLSLYLLTFILCFDHPRWYQRRWVALACLIAIVGLSGRNEIPVWFGQEWDYGLTEVRWIHLAAMFLICFLSHGELYRRRPVSHRYLTEFYLWVSFGGACGGLFVALFATHLFNDYYEWPLCLIAGVILAVTVLATGKRRTKLSVAAAAFAAVGLSGLILYWEDPLHWRVASNAEYSDVRLHQSRSFYGTIAVKERRYHHAPLENYRVFYSGEITHGLQYIHPSRERLATSYYSPESGAGETLQYAMARQPSLRVAVIGLGAGTLATYARETDHYDFYEIDPDAVQVARQWFTNLSNCRARVSRVIIGDARLKMEQLPENVKYDVILLDAFTGGSVPVHLLTQEAFQIYKRHLATDGFIAMNITNGYLNLYPVVRRQAEALGIGFRNKFQPSIRERHVRHNHYFVMTDDQEYLRRFPSVNRRFYDADGRLMRVQDPNLPDVPIWTDHFSSLTPIEIKD